MKRMKDRPSPIYEIHDYSHPNNYTILITIPNFIKKHGTTPYEMTLYIPSVLLPSQFDDFAIIAELTMSPCYYIGSEFSNDSPNSPVYAGCLSLDPGVMLKVSGIVDEDDSLVLQLSAKNLITGVDISEDYVQSFFAGLELHDGLFIMYSLNEISPAIRKIKDAYR